MKLYRYDSSLAGISDKSFHSKELIILQKATGCALSYVQDDIRLQMINKLNNIKCNKMLLLHLILAQTEGAFRPQLNYLGLFNSLNVFHKTVERLQSKLKLNNRAVNHLKYNGMNYYYLTKDALMAADIILSNIGSGKNIISTNHNINSPNLEHSSAVCDFLMYAYGNEHYPALFKVESEYPLYAEETVNKNMSDKVCVADFKVVTAFGYTKLLTEYYEAHTGTQRASVIVDKIYNYICCLDTSNTDMTATDIVFINHPHGITANDISTPLKYRNTYKDITSLYEKLENPSELAVMTSLLLYFLPDANNYIDVLNVLNRCDGIYEELEQIIPLISVPAAAYPVLHTILSCVSQFLKIDTTSEELVTLYQDHITTVMPFITDNKHIEATSAAYTAFVTQKDMIFNTIRYELPKNYPSAYKKLKNMFLSGFSIYTVYGADMYNSYLSIHPGFTGAAQAIYELLSNKALIRGNVPLAKDGGILMYPGGNVGINSKHIILRNMITLSSDENDNSNLTGSRIFIEDLDNDYGAKIRIQNLINCSECIPENCRVICIVNSPHDAYYYLAEYCYLSIKRKSLVSVKNISEITNNSDIIMEHIQNSIINLPVFITRQDIKSIMRGLCTEHGFFIFTDVSLYNHAAQIYGHLDHDFPKFFRHKFLNEVNIKIKKDLAFL